MQILSVTCEKSENLLANNLLKKTDTIICIYVCDINVLLERCCGTLGVFTRLLVPYHS